jgi:hypothetical protein
MLYKFISMFGTFLVGLSRTVGRHGPESDSRGRGAVTAFLQSPHEP